MPLEVENVLTGIAGAPSVDGSSFSITLRTQFAAPLTFHATPDDIEGLVKIFTELATKAGAQHGKGLDMPPEGRVSVVPIAAGQPRVILAGPGKVGLAFRFGILDLCFELPSAALLPIGTELSSLGVQMSLEPRTPQ